jgi:NAD(P)-dependent dehydrogenase (short-subunit alcohol dehydrogenase family)
VVALAFVPEIWSLSRMAETRHVRAAIVTGAARGIGAGISRRLVNEGWRIACADLDGAAVDAVAAETGGIAIQCDVGSEPEVERLVTVARARLGRIDAIVSNAGTAKFAPLDKTTLADWNQVLATNLTATFLLAKAAAADLRQTRGAMVTIASTRAHMSEPGTLAYSASKGGLVALTHALAMTLAPDVRVNCISPGWIDTGKHGPLKASDHAQHPVGRVGRPEDVAAAVAFLLSEEAEFITGAELIVDGGMTRKMIYT